MRSNIAIIAALIGVVELLGALGCLICTLMFGNVTNTAINQGQLYSKYYESATATRRHSSNGGTYWWVGLPVSLSRPLSTKFIKTRRSYRVSYTTMD